ncbi:hypothetical protein P9112_005101 [Eukaryota sp. TZLM1-RC]
MSVDPCNASDESLVNSEIHNPVSNAENLKFKKYNELLSKLSSQQHAKYNLYPFGFSLFGSLAPTALRFLDDFEMIVKRRTNKNFHRLFWRNRIAVFIFKGMLKMVSDALLSLGSHYEEVASSVFVLREMDYLDVDLWDLNKIDKKIYLYMSFILFDKTSQNSLKLNIDIYLNYLALVAL